MRCAFRVDASYEIGTGHVMRCLTLAVVLRDLGATCHFLCRGHRGHLAQAIVDHGFACHLLPAVDGGCLTSGAALPHAAWLGVEQDTDVRDCQTVLHEPVDWLVVDHYGLDVRWERAMRSLCRHLLVIDDLADRDHLCDVLLDQNLGREASAYTGRVPASCRLLIGPEHALLRSEFARWRTESLERRKTGVLRRILLTMGGVDRENATGRILDELSRCMLPEQVALTVVMGPRAPWLESVRSQCAALPFPAEVLAGVSNMAELMSGCDLAIGAAGTTAWERCCLGLPSLIAVLADNQRSGAEALERAGCGLLLVPGVSSLQAGLDTMRVPETMLGMQRRCTALTDGSGSRTLAQMMLRETAESGSLRPMRMEDLETVLGWRNHAEVRRYMFTRHVIGLAEHANWFARASVDPTRRLLIFEVADKPCGFVHFTGVTPGGDAEWGFYKAPDAPRGTGRRLGWLALDCIFRQDGVRVVLGRVMSANLPSIRMHKGLGFRDVHGDAEAERNQIRFVLTREQWMNPA